MEPTKLSYPKNFDLKEVGISQSLWNEWLTCNRRLAFKINGYRSHDKAENFYFGNLIHEISDKIYSKGIFPSNTTISKHINDYIDITLKEIPTLDQQFIEMQSAKAEATLQQYFKFYRKDFKTKKFYEVEKVFEVEFHGATLRGKIDGKYKTRKLKKWLMEHKTKSQIDETNLLVQLNLDFQNLYYILADSIISGKRAHGVLYNVIRNTQAKPLKNESLKNYRKRIYDTIESNPEHFFKRWEIIYTKSQLEQFKLELKGHINELKRRMEEETNFINPNRFACLKPFKCPYLNACANNSCNDLIYDNTTSLKVQLFPELKETNNADKKVKKTVRKKVAQKLKKKIAIKKRK